MELVYFSGSNNVGDELNTFLWPHLFKEILGINDGDKLFGIGTLLNLYQCNRHKGTRNTYVIGTGAGYGPLPKLDESWHFLAVRGPKTATLLNLDPSCAIADSAYLLSTLDWKLAKRNSNNKPILIPHHETLTMIDWESVCNAADIEFVSPLLKPNIFMNKLCQAPLVLAEAMHGAILADIVRTPWVPFKFSHSFHICKWQDWLESFNMVCEPQTIPSFFIPSLNKNAAPFEKYAKWIKARAASIHMGLTQWNNITPPTFNPTKSYDKLFKELCFLKRNNGFLTKEDILKKRTEQLYEKVNLLRNKLGLPRINDLVGDPSQILQKAL